MKELNLKHEAKRYGCAVLAATIMALNIKTFVRAGGLFPGGFTGLTLLIQNIFQTFMGIAVPYTLINVLLNSIPVFIGLKFIGKKFTISSVCVIVLSGLLTDIIPSQPITYDTLLISIFGGLINGFCISLCLIGNTSTGGTDFIVRAKPCLPLWSFSLIRKTELWKTNKPPAMQVSQHCFSLQKKTSGGIINVGSPTALIYTGGIHMDNNSLSHTKWNCKYHIVFAPKYRRKVAYGKIKQDIADILSMLCKRKGVKIIEAEICPDHVHMLVEIPPSISVSYFVGYLKGKSTLMIFERHANLKYKYGNRHFWCRGYYVDTVGKNAKKIQEYIANQLQDDLEYDQMTLKEYIDPFTGEPVKRNK